MAASLVECICVWFGPTFGLEIRCGKMAARLVYVCACVRVFNYLGQ